MKCFVRPVGESLTPNIDPNLSSLPGANINAQTEETQETALTLSCCGGFLEVADFLIKAGADIELGCSTPLMEAAQEGHLELVKHLLTAGTRTHTWSWSNSS
jgi:ankyrin repeat protein